MPDHSADGATAPRDTWRLAIERTEASTGANSARFTACSGEGGTNYRQARAMLAVAAR